MSEIAVAIIFVLLCLAASFKWQDRDIQAEDYRRE